MAQSNLQRAAMRQLVDIYGVEEAARRVRNARNGSSGNSSSNMDELKSELRSLRSNVNDLASQVRRRSGQRIGTGDRDSNIARSIHARSARQAGKGGVLTSEPVTIEAAEVASSYQITFNDEVQRRMSGTRICFWQVLGLTDVQEAAQIDLTWEANGVETFGGVSRIPLNIAIASFTNPNELVEIVGENGETGERLAGDASLVGTLRVADDATFAEDVTLRFQVSTC